MRSTRLLFTSVLIGVIGSLIMLANADLTSAYSPDSTARQSLLADTSPTPSAAETGYQKELLPWIRSNAARIGNFGLEGFFYHHDLSSLVPANDTEATPTDGTPAEDRIVWKQYQQAIFKYEWKRFGLEDATLAAPLNQKLISTQSMQVGGAGYKVDVFVFDALPGMRRLVNMYYPQGRRHVPLVLMPMGCNEKMSDADSGDSLNPETTSPQRLGANLALQGMAVFTLEGFCLNTLKGSTPGEHPGYEYYNLLADSYESIATLQLTAWLRLIKMASLDTVIDPERVGCVGYSFGAYTCEILADSGVAFDAIATTGQGFTGAFDGTIFPEPLPAMLDIYKQTTPQLSPFYWAPTTYTAVLAFTDAELKAYGNLSPLLKRRAADSLSLAAPAANLMIVGQEDNLVGTVALQSRIARINGLYERVYPDATPPQLQIVPGSHAFGADRRLLAIKFLSKELKSTPLLVMPDDHEFNTPVLSAQTLMPPSAGTGQTLRAVFASRATKRIAEKKAQTKALDRKGFADAIKQTLRLTEPTVTPPLLLLDQATLFTLSSRPVQVQAIAVPLGEDILVPAFIMNVSDVPSSAYTDVYLYLGSHNDFPLPAADELVPAFEGGNFIIVIGVLPGFGLSQSSQRPTGMVAMELLKRQRSLMGLGVEYVQTLSRQLAQLYPKLPIHVIGMDTDSSIVATYAVALEPKITDAELREVMPSIQTLMTGSVPSFVPPSLLVPGIAIYCDPDTVRSLVSPGRIRVASTTNLQQFADPW